MNTKEIVLEKGVLVDFEQAWRKVISRQHVGSPGRAVGELTQNTLDSYPSGTSWSERHVEIVSSGALLEVRDNGEGLDLNKLKLMLTLGGSDKRGDASKIGQFGMGFYTIFNPALGTQWVKVRSASGEGGLEVVFHVDEPGKPPRITAALLDEAPPYSTAVQVQFATSASVQDCLTHARERLQSYRSPATINGELVQSIWTQAEREGVLRSEGSCEGFVREGRYRRTDVTLMCKYERILDLSVSMFLTGGHGSQWDLRVYAAKSLPYLPNLEAVVNCNDLNVTVSRDGFYLDSAWRRATEFYGSMCKEVLLRRLGASDLDPAERSELVLANQYALQKPVAEYLAGVTTGQHADLYRELVEAKIYRLDGHREEVSLQDIKNRRTEGLPVYFSPTRTNLRWLGGAFKHDFVVLPPVCRSGGGAPKFYEELFGKVFGDVVNLETIQDDRGKLSQLVQRGIISREALSPKARTLRDLQLNASESALLDEINGLLRQRCVRDVVSANLGVRVRRLRASFFKVEDDAVRASTGLFNAQGKILNTVGQRPQNVVIGLRLDHPFFRHLRQSAEPNRAYYALTYVSHQLVQSQQLLVPDTPAFHFVKNTMAAAMRRGLTQHLLSATRAVDDLMGAAAGASAHD